MVNNTQPGARKEWNKTRDIINQFHTRLTRDKFLKKIFHFCICTPMEQVCDDRSVTDVNIIHKKTGQFLPDAVINWCSAFIL